MTVPGPSARHPGRELIASLLRTVPDFPTPGIQFSDIAPLLASPEGLAAAVGELVELCPSRPDAVVGIEARGFILGAPVALASGAGFVPVRKPGKLPGELIEVDYELEYGSARLGLQADALRPGSRVVVVDDVLATGGTVAAAAELVRRAGAELAGVVVLLELLDLGGRDRVRRATGLEVETVLRIGDS